MALQHPQVAVDVTLLSTEEEVKNLLEMFEFFLLERSLGKSVESLGEAVRDVRLILGRILVDHFLKLPAEREPHFCATLGALLVERATELSFVNDEDREYIDYCIEEILRPFEYAQEIKAEFPGDPVMQRILAVDVPLLQPFDYGLRFRLRLVRPLAEP